MNDVVGQQINIGDKVVTNLGGYLDLKVCYVDSFTDKKVRLFRNGASVGCKFSNQVAVVCSDGTSLPNHPDSTAKISHTDYLELINAINKQKAIYLGRSESQKDCFWIFYVWKNRYYCFLNDIAGKFQKPVQIIT